MNKVILDASALLTLINDEKGADIIEALIRKYSYVQRQYN